MFKKPVITSVKLNLKYDFDQNQSNNGMLADIYFVVNSVKKKKIPIP